ncbi:hypothetical protein NIES21_35980 [Anabaenopsis circularis NIES-21]|uniref:Uncharacterized protein n=1 Tax=Anabaenopsis circularis NIES-21 TaxID=1085406 RepID=A0A1Z4GK67_9CYAN|nr:hypothetical protein NIES21_35980 [Anabaenopsis circularis NIES-21]
MRRYQIFYLIFFLTLAAILSFALFTDVAPLVSCDRVISTTSLKEKYYASPIELVVQPWRGQHNVYGTFLIPTGYKNDGFFTLTLPGNKTYCGQLLNVGGFVIPGLYPQPKNRIIRGYLNTRIAIWLIFQGHINDLKQPENWKLGYFESKKIKKYR